VRSALRFRLLGSGSGGNATLVEGGGTRLLIDAGLGPRELAERLQDAGVDPASLDAILLSHEHGDHAKGAPSFSRKWGVPLYGTRGTYAAAGFGACEIAGYEAIEAGTPLRIGALSVAPVAIPHDAAEPVAFTLSFRGAVLGHATDLGHISRGLCQAFLPCRALLVESNYEPGMLRDGPYPWSLKERILGPRGHLANADVGRFIASEMGEGCGHLVLAHLSQQNNHPELVRMTAETALARRGRSDVEITVSGADGTGWIELPAREPEPRPASGRQLRLF